jgi:two-component system invasion response regulator UvrY
MYNILMASNYPVFIKGLSAVTKEMVAGEVEIQKASSLAQLDVVLANSNVQMLALDLHLFEGKEFTASSLKDFEKLVESHPSVNIVVLYDKMNKKLFKWMYLLGIHGVLGKASSISDIQACMQKVYKNQLYVENDMLVEFIGVQQHKAKKQTEEKLAIIRDVLTDREKMVAKLLIEGKNNSQICSLLELQPSTVSTFKHQVFKKLQIKSIIELEKLKQIAV